MRNTIIYFIIFLSITITSVTHQAKAQETCKVTHQKINSFGIFRQYACPKRGEPIISDETPQFIYFNKKQLIKDFDIDCSSNRSSSVFICSAGAGRNSSLGGCNGTQYLIDTNDKKIALFEFGIKNACNQIQSFSEKQGKIKITLRQDTSFIYDIKSKALYTPMNNENYTPTIDEDSPAFDKYAGHKKYPGLMYNVAPPYSQQMK